jgi:hypothetical protein
MPSRMIRAGKRIPRISMNFFIAIRIIFAKVVRETELDIRNLWSGYPEIMGWF